MQVISGLGLIEKKLS